MALVGAFAGGIIFGCFLRHETNLDGIFQRAKTFGRKRRKFLPASTFACDQ
ncbi:MAG: hypothetical protein ABSG80_08145 [Verrucomicrobiota bacterium]